MELLRKQLTTFEKDWSYMFDQALNTSMYIAITLITLTLFLVWCNQSTVTGLDLSRTCVRDVYETINFGSCRTWLFLNKHIHEHTTFSIFSVREVTLRNHAYIALQATSVRVRFLKTNDVICFKFSILLFGILF